MITVPHTYFEWVSVLDTLKARSDDEAVLNAMKQGTIEWQTGVAERFAKRLIDTINHRMNTASDRFQTDMGRAAGQEGAMIRALLSLRKEMSFLYQAINLPVLPDQDRRQYLQLVVSQADTMQKSLEDSASKDRSGKMSSIIRNHKVNTFQGGKQ